MGDDGSMNAVSPGPFQTIGVAAITDDGANLGGHVSAFNGVDNGLQITALAGDQYNDG